MSDSGRRAEDVAFEHLKKALVEKGVREFEEEHLKSKGRRPPKASVESVRRVLETSPGTDDAVQRELDEAAGLAQREGVLDSAAVLLWGVSGSLVAALVWEHRAVVPGALTCAVSGAFGLQFRGALRRRLPGWRGLALVLVIVAAVLVLLYREDVWGFVARMGGVLAPQQPAPNSAR